MHNFFLKVIFYLKWFSATPPLLADIMFEQTLNHKTKDLFILNNPKKYEEY